MIHIDPFSQVPLLVESLALGNSLCKSTGFIVTNSRGEDWLITNWHVVAGRNAETTKVLHKTGAVPDSLRIYFHSADRLGSWQERIEQLYLNEVPRWREIKDSFIYDVVALPIARSSKLNFYPLPASSFDADIAVFNSEPVSIVGFPLGETSVVNFPIWKTGHIASDIELPSRNKPLFLIDARTKNGSSGSPVIARRMNGYYNSKGTYLVGARNERFLGVYAGRTSNYSDIGMVWRAELVTRLIEEHH